MTSVHELSCIFCKESFEDKESLQIHFRKHGDPKFNQTARAKLRVQNDSPTSSDASRDDNEMVSCDVCDEVFPTISKAITHKHKVHPDYDAKYFCPWCGKLFTLKYLYNKHLESTHDSMPNEVSSCFHCDCCDVDFFVPSAMVYHNKLFHRQDRDMTSVGYSKKVKFLCQELVQIYYCPFCGEEYENKVNLNKHVEDDHSDENQSPEDILRCPLCEAIFYHLDAYELHLTFHSSEDLYSEENEMIKHIVEFSLDSVPPLVEKLDNLPMVEENDELNTMGVDQFLQLTMSKDTEEQQDLTEKVKSKKHKKHKKSKKSITLDEFLNMNTDLFGEGLNIQGIEEVPTRVVTKQLKSKKEPVLKNSPKHKVLPPDIDKLKKQGITIKMKSAKKIVPTNIQQPISAIPITTPKKSNVISTSSEVLSKLMNQSNNQIKIVKKATSNNPNVGLNTNESNNTNTSKSEETHDAKEDADFFQATDNINVHSTSETDLDKNGEENTQDNDTEIVQSKEIQSKSPLSMETMSNSLNEKDSNETSDDSNEMTEADDFNPNQSIENNIRNQRFVTKNPSLSITSNTNQDIHFEEVQTLNDFEESLVGAKIPRTENSYKESQNNEDGKKNVIENNETIVEKKDKTNNTLSAIKHLSHLITVKPVIQSKPSPKSKEDDTINHSSQNQVEKLNLDINNEDEEDNMHDNCAIPISKLENQQDHTPKALNALKNLSKHVTIKSLTSQVSSPKLDKSNDDNDNPDSVDDDSDNPESANRSLTNNVVGRKVVNLDNRNKTEPVIICPLAESPMHGISKKLIMKKTLENDSESNSRDENIKINTSNSELLRRLTNVTAKAISSKMPITQQPASQTLEQCTNYKKGYINERMVKQEKVNEEIEIFNIDDSDSDQDKPEEKNEPKNTKLPFKSVSDNKDTKSIPKSFQALCNLGKTTVKSNAPQTSITRSSIKNEENFSDGDEDFDQNNERVDKSMTDFIDHSNKMLQSTLKNLSKHLTVKSRNSQNLSHIRKRDEKHLKSNDSDSDSDYAVGKVKITEITDHAGQDEFLNDGECKNFVQSPNSNSTDVEDNFTEDENPHFSDDDNYSHHAKVKIKSNENPSEPLTPASLLRHTVSTEGDNSPLGNFKKFNKEITIKSLNESKRTNRNTETEEENTSKDQTTNNVNKEMSLKPYKQNVTKCIKTEHQPTSSTVNEKVGSSNQMSTINKEISVKTFQSQTVIEEITTTVTKTIRTVNQTVKQEVKNVNQVNTNPTFRPHKIINFNQSKNAHNATTIRKPSPSIGTKVKNIVPSKPTTSGIRPTNQLVSVRPGLNIPKASNSRAPVIRNATPSKPSPQNTVACRTLKISPQARNQALKRPSQESTGQLSCFKKPRESPTDIQTSRGEQEGEIHMSATQSRSDFTSTVKSMKGKTLVTSTQMKSEMSVSSHLTKLGNMSGLKIIKTSSKQSTQVEERVESSDAKKTMEALQKLQMQGLLVKRPRTDDNDDNDFSNSGSENDDET